MIILHDIHLPIGFDDEDIVRAARKEGFDLRGRGFKLEKLSLDARKKPRLQYIATITFSSGSTGKDKRLLSSSRSSHAMLTDAVKYQLPESGSMPLKHRPVIIGAGPAGLFCALTLAQRGFAPIIVERGCSVAERTKDVRLYWETGKLNADSNVQFGEGGAGTFSDGKLHTQVKDRSGRIRRMLEVFVDCGAAKEILYWNKPHIGTDTLKTVVANMSDKIRMLGGKLLYQTKVVDIIIKDGQLSGLRCDTPEGELLLETETAVLAIGHSARDTFRMLSDAGVPMHEKAFAVGIRVQHPQSQIQLAQYGVTDCAFLPVADYKLTAKASDGRGVYSFCMCPGGQVVDASSEPRRIAVNGMSNSSRDGRNANSAIVVTVNPDDFKAGLHASAAYAAVSGIPDKALSGIEFQRRLESSAYIAGEGRVPVQLLGDFIDGNVSHAFGDVLPDICGRYSFGDLNQVLPPAICSAINEGFVQFDRSISGFGRRDAVLAGVESRTSSPVRIDRDDAFESALRGLFPCGEGAGYAGGITSAAVDGIKVAEEIIKRYSPADNT